ncbi:hypothetical protein CAPTEDRAFT_192408 [Capitella teleta]|uniref:CARD domain-containing protein n=1 Tax=Capitella teleta TaxID=283909 RepID=R7VCY5_CAPTE|nr:hypothetical protein CAPTEDRAFT_192408 [Capitella teleta]|eukprot:ELU16668.1 hypothetical protein CAPTEDRAFT_192408 [Capitella teleta]
MVSLERDLDALALRAHLLQGRALTEYDVELIEAEKTRKNQAGKLVGMLMKKGPDAYEVFIAALEESQPYLHKLLQEGAGSTCTVNIFADITRQLKTHYTSTLKDIYTAVWLQEVPLDLNEVYVRIRLISAVGIHGLPNEYKDVATKKAVKEITQDEIFGSCQKRDAPSQIMVEGNPGVGKSTLCQKLAFAWSSGSCGDHCSTPCIHSFDIVIYLTAADFKGFKDVASLIRAHLLPKDFRISVNAISSALRDRCVLFLVDGYDESYSDNPLLHDVIQRKVSVQSTILLTSRPNYLREMLRYFDTRLHLDGFNAQQRQNYIEKFARHTKRPLSKFEHLLDAEDNELNDLCSTPLNLAILCIMRNIHKTSFGSRTELYKAVHQFIMKKASVRLNLSLEKIHTTIINPLCQLSFEAYMKGNAVLIKEDIEQVCSDAELFCKSGYLIKKLKISLLCDEIRFSFSHRTFQEFLTAIYVKQLPEKKRQECMNAVDLGFSESVLMFLFEMLKDDDEAILSVALRIMDQTGFSIGDPFERDLCEIPYDCPKSHLLMRCMGELKTISPRFEDIIIRNFPSLLVLHEGCSSKCIKAVTLILSLDKLPPKSISVMIQRGSQCYPKSTIYSDLANCKSVNQITLINFYDSSSLHLLRDACLEMRVGQHSSYIQHLHIYRPEIEWDLPFFSFCDDHIGKYARGLEISHNTSLCINPVNELLAIAQKKPLNTFGFSDLSSTESGSIELVRELSVVLKNLRLQNVTLNIPIRVRKKLIPLLSSLKDLRSLEIDAAYMKEDDWENFGRVLKKKTLQKLTLNNCDFSKECCDVLSHHFQTMSSLVGLHLKDGDVSDGVAFGRVISSACNVQTLVIRRVNFRNETGDVLSETLPNLKNLKVLEIVVLQRVTEVIAQCKNLEFLSFTASKQISDDVVDNLCGLVTSLIKLRCMRLPFDLLSENGNVQLSACFKLKSGKRIFWDKEVYAQ